MNKKFKNKIFVIVTNLLSKTWRYKIKGIVPRDKAIIVFWHGLMLPCWKIFSDNNPTAVISTSKDGQILADLLKKWNFDFIRGSSSKGGKEVLEKIIEKSKSNAVLITPDGPKGPHRKFKAGAVVAAQRAQVPLYLLKADIKNKLLFKKSWDKFEFPLPFSLINIIISDPLMIAKELDKEAVGKIISNIEEQML